LFIDIHTKRQNGISKSDTKCISHIYKKAQYREKEIDSKEREKEIRSAERQKKKEEKEER
jgi:hypothetical protein